MTTTTAGKTQQKAGLNTLLIAYFSFILLGLNGGLLGVAWPSLQEAFNVNKDAMAILLLPGSIAYTLASTFSGRAITWRGMGAFLLGGAILQLVGLTGFALAGTWGLLLLVQFVTGLGGGSIDSGYNTYIATNYSASRMSWLHAAFGVGATMGPILMQAVLSADLGWRAGYMIVAGTNGILALLILSVFSQWRIGQVDVAGESAEQLDDAAAGAPMLATLRVPAVWLGILMFLAMVGVEMTAGSWSYSLFTEQRGVSPEAAAMWTSIFWASLTVGRIIVGIIVDRVGSVRVLRWSIFGVLAGAIMMSVPTVNALGFAGLSLLGFAMGPLFPVMIGITPARIGSRHVSNAIGFMIGAAGLAFIVLPGLVGFFAESYSLEVTGPLMTVTAVIMWGAFEAGLRIAPVRE